MAINKFTSRGWLACILSMLFSLGACATLPDIEHVKESIQPKPVPTVVGPTDTVPKRQAKKILQERLGKEHDRVKELAAIEEAATGRPLIKGNKVKLLIDGPDTLAAMMKAIESATDHINLETFIFEQDEIGIKFAELLKKKQRQGVQVNIIYDSFGTRDTPDRFFESMREAGIRLTEFNPLNLITFNNRSHRKILVVDGKIAFTGGINISDEYSSSSLSSVTKQPAKMGWRDTHLQIEGPAVAALQRLFLETWHRRNGKELEDRDYFPPLKEEGDELIRIISTHPRDDYSVFKAYALAMQHATSTINLTIAYFAPDRQIIDSLLQAARRGVDVRIILPSVTDSDWVYYAGRSYYRELLKGGVRIFELQDSVLHAKTAVIDGVWSTVGSANLDIRSFMHNTEANAVILGKDFARTMEKVFERDLKNSREVTLEDWEKRPLSERFKEWFARRFKFWL